MIISLNCYNSMIKGASSHSLGWMKFLRMRSELLSAPGEWYILFNFYWFLLMQIHFVWILCYTVAVIFLPLMHRHCSNSLLVSTQINTIHQHYLLRIKRQTELFLPNFLAISENTLHTTSQPDESSTIPHRVYFLHFFPSPFLCTCKAFGLLCWIICHLPNPPSR